eukprot:10372486-Alexandrium_andersonii.AAC.1
MRLEERRPERLGGARVRQLSHDPGGQLQQETTRINENLGSHVAGHPVIDQVVLEDTRAQSSPAARARRMDVEQNARRLRQPIHHALEASARG